jgi:SAM-dependent methyltransferase
MIRKEISRLQRDNISSEVRSFYERYPFPGYGDTDSPAALVERAQRGVYARLLDRQIPFGARVLDVGCGTGQLVNFLALGGRIVTGCDLSGASLEKAIDFQRRFGIKNASFVQGDLFSISLSESSFDYILCNGVLHHTGDPYGGFVRLCRWLMPGGCIVVGLYSRYGRKLLQVCRFFGKLNEKIIAKVDRSLRRKDLSEERKLIWFMDQYKHPHESTHTIEEVLRWFKKNNVHYLNSIPKIVIGERFCEKERLFAPHRAGGKLQHFLKQVSWMFSQGREGGYFIVIGRKCAHEEIEANEESKSGGN